jgi:hypothetical protein
MATLNTTNIKHASSSSNNIVLNSNGTTAITGHIIQTTYAQYKTQASVAGDAYTDSGLTGNITTAASSNKVLVRVCMNVAGDGPDRYTISGRLYRGGSHVTDASASDNSSRPGSWFTVGMQVWGNYTRYNVYAEYLDSPGSAAAHQYKVYLRDHRDNDTIYINRGYYDHDGGENPVGTCSITLQEIVA